MKEIKVGEYFRTENGKIHKWSKGRTYTGKNRITKHSSNIIDLIECGDYVNGKEVVYDASESKMYNGHKTIGVSISNDNSTTWTILDTEIKSIVTKEQINQMKFYI